MERSAQQLQIKESQTLHKIKMDNLTSEEVIRQQRARWESEREHLEKTEQIKQKSSQENTDIQVTYIRKLKVNNLLSAQFTIVGNGSRLNRISSGQRTRRSNQMDKI